MLAQAVDTNQAWVSLTTLGVTSVTLYTAVNLLSYIRNKDWNATVKTLLPVVFAYLVLLYLSNADITQTVHIVQGAPALKDLDTGSMIALAAGVGSLPHAYAEGRKTFDNSDSAKKPPLIK